MSGCTWHNAVCLPTVPCLNKRSQDGTEPLHFFFQRKVSPYLCICGSLLYLLNVLLPKICHFPIPGLPGHSSRGQKPTVRVQTSLISAFVSPSVPLHRSFPHFSKWTWLICNPLGIPQTQCHQGSGTQQQNGSNPNGLHPNIDNSCLGLNLRASASFVPPLFKLDLADLLPPLG